MGKDFLSIKDISKEELEGLFSLTDKLKALGTEGVFGVGKAPLKGKVLVLIFEKPSLRTRVTFETGIYELGGNPIYLSRADIGLGSRESIKDIAQNLSQWVSGIVARVFAHQTVIELASYASIPVINALSELEHPCQALADLFTIYEKFKTPDFTSRGSRVLKGEGVSHLPLTFASLKFAYIGDGNNVCHSLMLGAKLVGLNMWVASPKGYEPKEEYINLSNAKLSNNPVEAVRAADIVYTDVWASMGQEEEKEERLIVFKDFQVNSKLLEYAKPNCLIMHCLPAHRGEEITSEVLDSPNSLVLAQSTNRLWVQKALLTKLITI